MSSELESDVYVYTVYTVGAIWWKAMEVTAGLAECMMAAFCQVNDSSHLRADCLYTGISSGPNAQ